MNAVSGTRRAIKELVDGTIRVSIDVDPQHRKRFFELFSDIDMPVAIAPLVQGFEQPKPETDRAIEQAAAEAVKGGPLAKLAGQLCNDPSFQLWVWENYCSKTDPLEQDHPEETAAEAVRRVCGVKSRAELDHNTEAAERFHGKLRKPFLAFMSRK